MTRPTPANVAGAAFVPEGVRRVRGNVWYLRNTNSSGPADIVFQFGAAGDKPLVWR